MANKNLSMIWERLDASPNKEKYRPKLHHVCYHFRAREFVATGFWEVCPTLCARDYKDPKLVIVEVPDPKVKFLGNIYGHGQGYAGAVFDKKGVCPTLTTMQGGNRQPMVIIDGN